jgi:hypothetical protein
MNDDVIYYHFYQISTYYDKSSSATVIIYNSE